MKKLFKKSISVLIAVLMIITSLPLTAITANAATKSGTLSLTGTQVLNAGLEDQYNHRWDSTNKQFNIVNDQGEQNTSAGVIRYDISGLTDCTVNSATLNYKIDSFGNDYQGLTFYWTTDESKVNRYINDNETFNIGIICGSGTTANNNWASLLGFSTSQVLGTVAKSPTSTASQTMNIKTGFQNAIDTGAQYLYLVITQTTAGGSGDDNGWTDTKLTPAKFTISYNVDTPPEIPTDHYLSINSFNRKTATAHGSFIEDSDNKTEADYANIYKNILYGDSNADYCANSGNFNPGGNSGMTLDSRIYYGNTVMLYDGITQPQMGIGFASVGVDKAWNWDWNNHRAYYCALTANGNGISIKNERWQGQDGRMNYTYIVAQKPTVNVGTTTSYTDYHQPKAQNMFYANYLVYSGDFADNYKKIVPTFQTKEGNNVGQNTHDLIPNKAIYVLNYKKVIDKAASISSDNLVASDYSIYSWNVYATAVNALYDFDPTDYDYTQTESSVQLAADTMGKLLDAVDTARANLEREYTFRFYNGNSEVRRFKIGESISMPANSATYAESNQNGAHGKYSFSWPQTPDRYNVFQEQRNWTNENCTNYYGEEKQLSITYATCTEDGEAKYGKICSLCGYTLHTKTVVLPATGHSYVYTSTGDTEHSVTCKNCDYNATEPHSFPKSNNFTCVCGYALNADAYNNAVTEADAIVAEKDIYTDASFNAYKAVYDECTADFTVKSQAELDAVTNKLISAKTYLVKKAVTITFRKEIGGTVTEETFETPYGKEITLDSGITDANITKWTAETADGTSAMHTSMSSVTYVPYTDTVITVYADDAATSAVNTKQVIFRTLNGSVQEVQYVKDFADVKMPAGKEYSFYTFAGWGEAKYSADGKTAYYDATYTFKSDADKCGVHFTYDDGRVKDYEYDAYIKLTNADSSKVYALSTTADMSGFITNIKGTSFHVPHNGNIYIIESNKTEATIGITGNYSTTTTDKRGVAVNAKFCLPEGAVKADAGYDVVMVKNDGTKLASQRIKCPNVNQYNEYTKSFTTKNTSVVSFEITPYVVYTTADGKQLELKGNMQEFTL